MSLQQQARALGDPTRFEIFQSLAAAETPLGVAELTERVGLHHNAVRQHLAKLVDAGLVCEERARPAGRGRPRILYVVAPGVESRWGVRGPYERLSVWLGEMVCTGDPPEVVGRRAGRGRPPAGGTAAPADPVGALIDGMAREGFGPELRSAPGSPTVEVALTRCPYAVAVAAVPEPVCRFHLGYTEGVAERCGPLVVDELLPGDPEAGGCRLRCHLPDTPDPA